MDMLRKIGRTLERVATSPVVLWLSSMATRWAFGRARRVMVVLAVTQASTLGIALQRVLAQPADMEAWTVLVSFGVGLALLGTLAWLVRAFEGLRRPRLAATA